MLKYIFMIVFLALAVYGGYTLYENYFVESTHGLTPPPPHFDIGIIDVSSLDKLTPSQEWDVVRGKEVGGVLGLNG